MRASAKGSSVAAGSSACACACQSTRQRRPRAGVRQLLHLDRPLLVIERQQRQVEQPLAGIVDEIEMERPRLEQAAEPWRRRQTQPHPHPAQPFRRLRPARRLGQKLGEALGVGKAWQARDVQKLDSAHALAPGEERKGLDRRVLGVQQRMHEGGHEHGLARALQAGDGDAIRVVLERRGTGERRSDGIQGRGGEASQSGKRCHGWLDARG